MEYIHKMRGIVMKLILGYMGMCILVILLLCVILWLDEKEDKRRRRGGELVIKLNKIYSNNIPDKNEGKNYEELYVLCYECIKETKDLKKIRAAKAYYKRDISTIEIFGIFLGVFGVYVTIYLELMKDAIIGAIFLFVIIGAMYILKRMILPNCKQVYLISVLEDVEEDLKEIRASNQNYQYYDGWDGITRCKGGM